MIPAIACRLSRLPSVLVAAALLFGRPVESAELASPPPLVGTFLASHCFDCHSGDAAEGGLDLESLDFDLRQRDILERWTLIHDRIRDGEMPPPDGGIPVPVAPIGWSVTHTAADTDAERDRVEDEPAEKRQMLRELARVLVEHDRQRVAQAGRSKVRRLNRYEYENTLRQVLQAPWLQLADALPEDGIRISQSVTPWTKREQA